MIATRTHTYRGRTIRPCVWVKGAHRGQWLIQTYHQSGVQWADEECPHYQTIAEAKEAIDREIAESPGES